MNFVEQLSAIALLVDFLLGVTFGIVGGASLGSRREDREYSLLRSAHDAVSDGARVIYGVYTCDDGYMASLLPGGTAVPGEADENNESGAQGQESDR
jgi:hypothetical protein